ncbi:hypothetical protein PV516_19075 [Streptomyces scabiei]|uniref:hypothetical protein n=1 Tax=Streptomyces scabiei TaxID=1930 RepID=UPI0029BA6CBC|nr:hypothetical protein [Streptomyces scabiei]MDX3165891.1 hypothetical protein [Streptomyces scabiei]
MSRRIDALKLRGPLPAIPAVDALGIRVSYPPYSPAGWTVALLRLPNDYYVVVGHAPLDQWAVVYRHYVVPGTDVADPRPLIVDPLTGTPMPQYIKWRWTDGRGISSVLRALAPLRRAPDDWIRCPRPVED